MDKDISVCVTGAAGYIGSWLVNKLLAKGYTVHATVRNLGESSKVGLLKGLRHADTRLKLFKADIYNAEEFETAIQGCQYVFHVATPLLHDDSNTKYKDTTEAAIAGVRSIAESCKRTRTVKRLIYTASVVAASPLKEDGSGYKESMDESCWTPLHIPFPDSSAFELGYISSKTLTEKDVLSYNTQEGGLEVVSLTLGLVGGEALLSYLPQSLEMLLAQLTGEESGCLQLKMLQELLGTLPLVHIDDVCEAHVFCIEQPSMKGRFICAYTTLTTDEMAEYFTANYPEIKIAKEFADVHGFGIGCSSTKLKDKGFEFKYDVKKILDDSVKCARRVGALPVPVRIFQSKM